MTTFVERKARAKFVLKIGVVGILGFVFSVYSASMGGGLISDDIALFHSEGGISELSLKAITHVQHVEGKIRPDYRPLTTLTFAADLHSHGLDVFWFHFFSVTVYLHAAFIFYLILRKLQFSPTRSLLGMALFAALPIHVQPVCWISGRPEVLCAFFVLLTVYLHLKGTWLAWAGALVCALLAAASKETGVILPVLLFAVDRAAGRKQVNILQYLGYIAVAVGFFALRSGMLGFFTTEHTDFGIQSLAYRIVLGTQYNAWGLFATLVPYKLVLFYPEISLGFWQGFSSTLLWGLTGILIWRLRNRWLLIALVLALVPTTGIVSTTPLADRYMLIPSIFVVIGLTKLFTLRRMLIPATVLVAVYFAISSYYIGDWQGRIEYARRWTQRYSTGDAHIDYSAALADIEGCLLEGADPLVLYHWYYADELYKLEGGSFPHEALRLREQILNKMELELGIPPAKQKYSPVMQNK